MPVAIFNSLMLAVDLALLAWLVRRPSPRTLIGAVLAAFFAIALFAGATTAGEAPGERSSVHFLFFALVTWGLFLHGIALLVGAGVILARRHARISSLCFLLAVIASAVIVDALWIEPRRLEITHHEFASAKITAPMRIVVLADIQVDDVGAYEREAFRAALAERPDLVLLLGDYVHVRNNDAYRRQMERLSEVWRESGLTAPWGVIAVAGNTDRADWATYFEGLGVQAVVDTRTIEVGEIVVTGLSRDDSFSPALEVGEREPFHIVAGHAPNYALGDISAELLLAGHTHGGQVRIPGFGPLITLAATPRSWGAGRTELEGGRTLIVSRGIGLERVYAPRIRLFCPPEIVVIDLVPATP